MELGSDATATKSAGVNVIPILNMSAANAAVKYCVVKNSNVDGRFNAMAVKRTVHSGKSVVAALAVLVYISNILEPDDFEESRPLSAGAGVAADSEVLIRSTEFFIVLLDDIMNG